MDGVAFTMVDPTENQDQLCREKNLSKALLDRL
jgi:hypothetical protein